MTAEPLSRPARVAILLAAFSGLVFDGVELGVVCSLIYGLGAIAIWFAPAASKAALGEESAPVESAPSDVSA